MRFTRRQALGAAALSIIVISWLHPLKGRQAPVAAAPPERPPLPAAPQPSATGLSLTFERIGADAAASDVRVARLPALYVPAGTPPSPFIAAGPFRATLEGELSMKLRDELAFSFAGRGSAKLLINDQAVLERSGDDLSGASSPMVRLNKGKNRLRVEYQSPATGDAVLRLYWSGADFPSEPVPPGVLSHDSSAEALRKATRLREGRELFAALRCAACHEPPGPVKGAFARQGLVRPEEFSVELAAQLAMPELSKDSPSLAAIGARLNEAWMAHWVSDPKALRPDATMPRIFHGGKDQKVAPGALDIAAFLATLAAPPENGAPTEQQLKDEETIAAGGRLFARRHCNACHLLPDTETGGNESNRIPLAYVKAKYKPAALVSFLKNPQEHYVWTGMPNFGFSDAEALKLAAFLLSREGKSLEVAAGKGDAARGQAFVAAFGCLNCHSIDRRHAAPSALRVRALDEITGGGWQKGCLAPDGAGRGVAPDFVLTSAQRDALLAFASSGFSSLSREALPEVSARYFERLRCAGCHARDNEPEMYARFEQEVSGFVADGVEDEPQGEEDEKFSPDQSTPPLTWAGERLRPEWTAQFITGELKTRYRPWLRARMPAFPAYGTLLAHGWPLEHGFATLSPAPPPAQPELAAAGRKLVAATGGFSCVTCHGAGDAKPQGVFEAPGINLRHSRDRLTHHYYTRWVYNPMRVHKDSKMPSYADVEGKTSIKEILDGDARRQYEAIWHYLMAGQQLPPPEN